MILAKLAIEIVNSTFYHKITAHLLYFLRRGMVTYRFFFTLHMYAHVCGCTYKTPILTF